jgi:ATP-dependent HslUV protease ATP-binding subunit HslU
MIRDLMEIGVNMVRQEETDRIRDKAEQLAEEALLDLLLPNSRTKEHADGSHAKDQGSSQEAVNPTREKFRQLWRDGKLNDRMVDVEVEGPGVQVGMMAMPGMEDMEMQFRDMFSRMFPKKKKTRKMKIEDAYEHLVQQESDRLIDQDKVVELAKERVEQSGIIFLDELDKVCASQGGSKQADISREGVQRDLLPVVEGCVVNTKYGMLRTDHILFIAAGAFHYAKPSDLIPELQGRFPLRVELSALQQQEFFQILTEPQNSLTVQYRALLETEGLQVVFEENGLWEIAAYAQRINEETENIGARRLYTLLEKVLHQLSFSAAEEAGNTVTIDAQYVQDQLKDIEEDRDLSRYIL